MSHFMDVTQEHVADKKKVQILKSEKSKKHQFTPSFIYRNINAACPDFMFQIKEHNAKKKNKQEGRKNDNQPTCGKHDVQSTGYRGNKVFLFSINSPLFAKNHHMIQEPVSRPDEESDG